MVFGCWGVIDLLFCLFVIDVDGCFWFVCYWLVLFGLLVWVVVCVGFLLI